MYTILTPDQASQLDDLTPLKFISTRIDEDISIYHTSDTYTVEIIQYNDCDDEPTYTFFVYDNIDKATAHFNKLTA